MRNYFRWLREERGLSEAATAIFVLPLIVAALFVIVETGFNIRTRAVMDHIVQDTTRMAALDGGNFNPTTNTIGMTWQAKGQQLLAKACADKSMRCATTPTMVCYPAGYALNVGEDVYCTATVKYKVISGLSTSTMFSFGFSGLYTSTITSTAHSVAAVAANG